MSNIDKHIITIAVVNNKNVDVLKPTNEFQPKIKEYLTHVLQEVNEVVSK